MSTDQVRYALLGPYPGNGSYSIVKYFDFYRQDFLVRFGEEFVAACPGGHLPTANGSASLDNRFHSWWKNYLLWPRELAKLKSDLFHISDQGLFWYARFLRGGRRVGTVHDLIAHLISSGTLKLGSRSWRRDLAVRENMGQLSGLDHIISVSRFTADCLVREMGTPAKRITVVPNHVDGRFGPSGDAARAHNRSKWFQDAEHAIIHVGRPLVYKNRLGAIKAFAQLYERLPAARMFLVNGPCTEDERKVIEGGPHFGAVHFIPAVTTDELAEIYGAADALIFPSYYEGFGWPPLEAMACGCPVVSSTRASLGEVVGDAALTVGDPDDHEALAARLKEILTSDALARDLRSRGLERARLFAPEKALEAVAAVYRMLA
jgi:glycosyltransferase involved in cell wall biosynthesis